MFMRWILLWSLYSTSLAFAYPLTAGYYTEGRAPRLVATLALTEVPPFCPPGCAVMATATFARGNGSETYVQIGIGKSSAWAAQEPQARAIVLCTASLPQCSLIGYTEARGRVNISLERHPTDPGRILWTASYPGITLGSSVPAVTTFRSGSLLFSAPWPEPDGQLALGLRVAAFGAGAIRSEYTGLDQTLATQHWMRRETPPFTVSSSAPPPRSFTADDLPLGFLRGDIDGDGSRTEMDAQAVLRDYLALQPALSASQRLRADITGDGLITAADALCLYQIMLKLPNCLTW